MLPRGRVTAPSSLPTPNTALRRGRRYAGATKPSVVSGRADLSLFRSSYAADVCDDTTIGFVLMSPCDLCLQPSSARGGKFIKNVAAPVETPVPMARPARTQQTGRVSGPVFPAASVHQD